MIRKKPEDLSVQEIRFLLVARRRAWRQSRLEQFYRTGRVVPLANEIDMPASLGELSTPLAKRQHTWLDYLLLGVELPIMVGLVAVVVDTLSMPGNLNRKVSTALLQPTLVLTPVIQAVVLPDGHTPPNRPEGARPNEAEIPTHLRPVWQSFASLPTPVPAIGKAVRIQIPAIGVDAPVVQGDGWEQLKRGVAQHIGTPDPAEVGNIALSGHNDIYGEVFRDLDRLNPGDKVILFTSQRQYTYTITGAQMVEPTTVEVMNPTSDSRVTLISCRPYLVDAHRIVVTAILQN
jgi:sortase A